MCICSYFNDNQYPDEAKREEIATACNAVIQKPGTVLLAKGCELHPKLSTSDWGNELLDLLFSINMLTTSLA